MTTSEKLSRFAILLESDQRRGYERFIGTDFRPELRDPACKVTVRVGNKFAKVDVGTSGKYMVDLATEEIFGIKAYGVVHRGHRYGTLDTIGDWDWNGYHAAPKAITPTTEVK